jgi:hypothetical protein
MPERRNSRARWAPRRLLIAVLALAALATGTAPAEAAVPREFFGVSARLPDAQDFKQMAQGGVGSVRIGIGWRGAQPTRKGAFNWTPFDREFREASTHGLRILPFLWGSPTFISSDSTRIVPPVRKRGHRRAWQRFVSAAVDRYSAGGQFWLTHPQLDSSIAPRDWLIWNEQNAKAFWAPAADPREYARLLRLSREAMDEVDPSSNLIVGGMYGYPNNERAMDLKPFMKRVYRQPGLKAIIDGVSLHPYGKNLKSVRRQVTIARRLMDRAGDQAAELTIGEIGWASAGDPHELVKSKPLQAKLLQQAFSMFLAKRDKWNIHGVYWYIWKDFKEEGTCPWCAKAGLINKKNEPKPAWNAYRTLIANRTG